MMLSSWATSSIEEVAEAAPAGLRWLQLYMYKDREVRESLVRRAERAGFRGIFVTVDTPYLGRRIADVRNKFQLPPHLRYICCWVWGGTVPGPWAAGLLGERFVLGNSSVELCVYLALCLGWDLLWVKMKLSWLFACCKRHRARQCEAAEVRDVGHFFIRMSMYSWLPSNLSWARPRVTCSDVELESSGRVGCALKGAWTYWAKTPFQKMLWFLLCLPMALLWVQGCVATDCRAPF